MRLLKSFLKFARPQIVISCVALVILGSLVSGSFNGKTLLAIILVTFAIVHANSINDYTDREIDKLNLQHAKDRPLVSGDLSDTEFWFIHYGSGIVALILSIFFGIPGLILTTIVIIVNYMYSIKPIRLTDRTYSSPLVLAVLYAYYPLSLGFWSTNSSNAYPWLLSIGICLAFVARMLLKDFRDVKGDKKYGKRTFLLRHGGKTTCIVSALLWLTAFSVTLYALHFTAGVLIPLPFGLFQVWLFLDILWKTNGKAAQQKIIGFIATAGNYSILTIFIGLLVQHDQSISTLDKVIIPATIGGALLILNFVSFIKDRSQLLKQTQRV